MKPHQRVTQMTKPQELKQVAPAYADDGEKAPTVADSGVWESRRLETAGKQYWE